jgi:hypothetical protein
MSRARGQPGSGQVRAGQERTGQDRSGQVRSGQVALSRLQHLHGAMQRALPSAACVPEERGGRLALPRWM